MQPDFSDLALMSQQDTDETFKPLLKLWNLPNQNAQLDRKMAMAKALATPKGQNYGTAAGNIAGGLGDALGQFAGGLQMRDLNKQMDANTTAMQDPAIFSSPLARNLMLSQILGGQGMAGMPQQKPLAALPPGAGGLDLFGSSGGMG